MHYLVLSVILWFIMSLNLNAQESAVPDPFKITDKDVVKRAIQDEEDLDPDWRLHDPFERMDIVIGRRAEDPPPELPSCKICQSTGKVPSESPLRPYILFETDRAPAPSVSLGWIACHVCERGKEAEQTYAAEQQRLLNRREPYKRHEEELQMSFVDFETRSISGHFQTSEQEANNCARLVEQVWLKLRERCGGLDTYTKTSPNTHRIIICENKKNYLAYLSHFSRLAGKKEDNWEELAKETASFGSDDATVIRRDRVMPPYGSGVEHMVVYSYGLMLIRRATDGKVPSWFQEGFASFCESLVLANPRCYSIRYESNTVTFEPNWALAVANAVKANKVVPWSRAFTFDQIGMRAIDYQQCWSMVRFLYRADGKGFAKLPELFLRHIETGKAIEDAYGWPLGKLEDAWHRWAAAGN